MTNVVSPASPYDIHRPALPGNTTTSCQIQIRPEPRSPPLFPSGTQARARRESPPPSPPSRSVCTRPHRRTRFASAPPPVRTTVAAIVRVSHRRRSAFTTARPPSVLRAPLLLPWLVGAEFVGTFILMFAGTATAIVNQKTPGSETLIGCAASSGLAVMIVILSTGHISGAHLNPAVTISFAALKHFPWKHVPMYIAAQVIASICAAFALKEIFRPFMSGGVTVPSGGYGQAFALEFIISFNLMFVVTGVATDTRAVGELAAIAVGATVMLNILIAGPATGASMNPVRTLGPAIAANNYKAIWVYLVAPILGALSGAGIYSAVKLPEEDDTAKAKAAAAKSFRR